MMPSFMRTRVISRDFLTIAALLSTLSAVGLGVKGHPPFCFAPVYTISPLHFKRIFES